MLWNDHLGRVDRALWHWQQAWKLEPQRTEALEAGARAVRVARRRRDGRQALPWPSSTCSAQRGDRTRKAQIRLELGKLALRGRTSRPRRTISKRRAQLDPQSLEIAETLAEVYANPAFREGQTRTRPASCSSSSAASGSRRATTRPASTTSAARSASIRTREGIGASAREALSETSQWDELDRILRHRSTVVHRAGRAQRGAAPARRAVSQPAAEPRRPDRGALRARRVRAARQQGDARAARSCCATTSSGTSCRG